MVEIKKQILVSTNLDSHGEKLTREQLYSLYESQPEELVINHEHDLGRPPVAIARSLAFQELPSGEFAITGDIEVHDEEVFRACGGFSMAWLADSYTLYPEASPDIEIYFNPRAILLAHAFELMGSSKPVAVFNVRELKQKGIGCINNNCFEVHHGLGTCGLLRKSWRRCVRQTEGKTGGPSKAKRQ